jgi:hypothetical protein
VDPVIALLLACTLDAVEGGDCARLPEGRNREDCLYASARTVRADETKLDALLAGMEPDARDALLLRLAADEPEAASRLCARVSPGARPRCGTGGSVVPRP